MVVFPVLVTVLSLIALSKVSLTSLVGSVADPGIICMVFSIRRFSHETAKSSITDGSSVVAKDFHRSVVSVSHPSVIKQLDSVNVNHSWFKLTIISSSRWETSRAVPRRQLSTLANQMLKCMLMN